jgi:hypothetical protein
MYADRKPEALYLHSVSDRPEQSFEPHVNGCAEHWEGISNKARVIFETKYLPNFTAQPGNQCAFL